MVSDRDFEHLCDVWFRPPKNVSKIDAVRKTLKELFVNSRFAARRFTVYGKQRSADHKTTIYCPVCVIEVYLEIEIALCFSHPNPEQCKWAGLLEFKWLRGVEPCFSLRPFRLKKEPGIIQVGELLPALTIFPNDAHFVDLGCSASIEFKEPEPSLIACYMGLDTWSWEGIGLCDLMMKTFSKYFAVHDSTGPGL
jgi:hypothetical protein